jgi:hypothetical protein
MMLTGVVIITREVDSSTSLAISEAVGVLIHNGNPLGKCPDLICTSPASPKLNFRVVCRVSIVGQVQAIIGTMNQYPVEQNQRESNRDRTCAI